MKCSPSSLFPATAESARSWYSSSSGSNAATIYLDSWWLKDQRSALTALHKLGWSYGEIFPKLMTPTPERGLMIGLGGGALLSNKELQSLTHIMNACDEQMLFVMENAVPSYMSNKTAPPIMLQFPSTVSWDTFADGDAVTQRFLDFCVGDYFVFGDSGKWGKLVVNDALPLPLEMLVYDHELMPMVCPWHKSFMEFTDLTKSCRVPESWLEQANRTERELRLVCAGDIGIG